MGRDAAVVVDDGRKYVHGTEGKKILSCPLVVTDADPFRRLHVIVCFRVFTILVYDGRTN